jgi:hypothetical protein
VDVICEGLTFLRWLNQFEARESRVQQKGRFMHPSIEKANELANAHCGAWSASAADIVAQRYSERTSFAMNGGEPMTSRAEIQEMAEGFMLDFPGLKLTCDAVLVADHHMVYAWTFVGKHRETGNNVRFSGWEEWDLNDNLHVVKSLGWYDVEDYNQQVAG